MWRDEINGRLINLEENLDWESSSCSVPVPWTKQASRYCLTPTSSPWGGAGVKYASCNPLLEMIVFVTGGKVWKNTGGWILKWILPGSGRGVVGAAADGPYCRGRLVQRSHVCAPSKRHSDSRRGQQHWNPSCFVTRELDLVRYLSFCFSVNCIKLIADARGRTCTEIPTDSEEPKFPCPKCPWFLK